MHTPRFSPVNDPSRLLQIEQSGGENTSEVMRHDLTLYFMKFQAEFEAFQEDMDKTANESDELLVVRKHWDKIFRGQ